VTERTIDPEHNRFWREGYLDGLAGMRAIVPDEAKSDWERSDYFTGHREGSDDRKEDDSE